MLIEKRALSSANPKVFYVKYLQESAWKTNDTFPAMVICPGGGYLSTSNHEAEPVALYFLNQGFQVFVLRYTTADRGNAAFPNPLYDLARLMAIIRENSDSWQIDPCRIAVLGFSAGGHLCASLATMWDQKFLSEKLEAHNELFCPNAAILAYPLLDCRLQLSLLEEDRTACTEMFLSETRYAFLKKANDVILNGDWSAERLQKVSPISYVSERTAPTFIWHTAEDNFCFVQNSLNFAGKLADNKVPFELHVFEQGPHGMSLANGRTATRPEEADPDVQVWTKLAMRFLYRRFGQAAG